MKMFFFALMASVFLGACASQPKSKPLEANDGCDNMYSACYREKKATAEGKPTKTPPIDQKAVREVVEGHLDEIETCYSKALNKNPKTMGKVILEWTAAEDGVVVLTDEIENTTGNKDLSECLRDRLRTWKFPPTPGASVTSRYPFEFTL